MDVNDTNAMIVETIQ